MRFHKAKEFHKVGVIGAGAWGTALAQVCTRAGREVLLQCREPEVADSINSKHVNLLYLPSVELRPELKATVDMSDMADCDLILAVPPAQHMRSTLLALAPYAKKGLPIVLCAKGIERNTDNLMNEVLEQIIPEARAAVLSGPSFAAEVAQGLPTAVTLACHDDTLGMQISNTIAAPGFRPYLIKDMIGAEAGGALKNVLAIACGISEGKGLGRSAHAALITRGFAEMCRLAEALGAKPETLSGLCGLGDLVLSCSSPQSRNMTVGLALGSGQTLEQALKGKISVAEGVESAPAVKHLGERLKVDLPICNAVAAILSGEADVTTAIGELLSRPLKTER
jgi:glycerol-3-phosphate dehydrogenase (NAD(P)+)